MKAKTDGNMGRRSTIAGVNKKQISGYGGWGGSIRIAATGGEARIRVMRWDKNSESYVRGTTTGLQDLNGR